MNSDVPDIDPSAKWIWPDGNSWNLHNCYALFRKSFSLKSLPPHAWAWITADQSYRLWVNGAPVCRGPARGFQRSWPCDKVDLAPFLRRGKNVIAVRAHNPGHGTFSYISESCAGFLFSMTWPGFTLVSNRDWKMRRQTGVLQASAPASMQMYDQEHCDLRKEAPEWFQPDFDESLLQCQFISERQLGSRPWSELSVRGIPLLEEKDVYPVALLGRSSGKAKFNVAATNDIVTLRHREDRSHQAVADGQLTKDYELTFPPAPGRRFQSALLDYGKTMVGCPIVSITGATGGEVCDILVYETIDRESLTPHMRMPDPSRIAMAHRIICRKGDNYHEFHLPYGFRYFEIVIRQSKASLQVHSRLRWIGYPLPAIGSFITSDPIMNKIWQSCAWTQQCCSLDAYVDTPWREQAQWWGDARVQAWNTFHLNGDTRLLQRGILQIGQSMIDEGLTYGHAPTIGHSCILPDFTLIWVLTMWDYYWQTGSIEPFAEQLPQIKRAMQYFETRIDPQYGLIAWDPRYWLFMDWAPLPKDRFPAALSMLFLLAVDKMLLLLKKLDPRGSKEGAFVKSVKASQRQVLAGVQQLRDDSGIMCDGRTLAGDKFASSSIHTQTLQLALGLANRREEKTIIQETLLPYLSGVKALEVSPSAYWITYIFTELILRGNSAPVVENIRRRWAAMAEHGTTWETFEPRLGSESHSHAWSAHPMYHLMQTVGGILQTDVAWKKVRFQPCFSGSSAKVEIPTPLGLIQVRWKRLARKKSLIDVELVLPKGIEAEVCLPDRKAFKAFGNRAWKVEAGS